MYGINHQQQEPQKSQSDLQYGVFFTMKKAIISSSSLKCLKILVKNSVQEDLERLKKHAVKYGKNGPTEMEKDLLSLRTKQF